MNISDIMTEKNVLIGIKANSKRELLQEIAAQAAKLTGLDERTVFDTLLENEYALMTLALKKSKDKDNQPLYDIEDIYEWIDYVREMGMEQSFK